jgi:hypothetical protein
MPKMEEIMGRKTKTRIRQNRYGGLQKRRQNQTKINSEFWDKPLIVPKDGYIFLAEWLLGDCEFATDLRKQFKVRLTHIEDSDFVMPFEIVGKGKGVSFIQHNLLTIDSFFDPIDLTDRNLKNYYNSQKFSAVITEIASQLLINGKLVSNSPLYYSLST